MSLGPDEYWKAVIYEPFKKYEKIYRGPGGRKRALEYVARARKKNPAVLRTVVLGCKPEWVLEEAWSSD